MIPTPPIDPTIPGLSTLLDEGAVTALLAGHLGSDIVSCQPRYVRYKPGASCLVMYDLVTCQHYGEPVTRKMHITVYGDERGNRRATSSKMERLVERAARLHGTVPVRPVAYLPEIDGLAQVFPIDYDLKYLVRASSAAAMTDSFQDACAGFEAATVTAEPELVRYKPARKALLRYRLDNAPVDALYGKLRTEDRTELLVTQTDALIAAGVATPAVRCTRSRHGFVAHETASGVQLASLRGTEAFAGWMAPLAGTLGHLQSVDVLGPVHSLADEAAVISSGIAVLKRIAPHLASRLDRAGSQVIARLQEMDDVVTTIHGDFYDDQALVSDAGVTIIDLDEMRRGHPLLDVGNMLAHLTSGEARGEDVGPAREAFLDATGRHGEHTAGELATFEATALLKLATGPFRRLEPDWPEAIERILGLVGTRLADAPVASRRHCGHRAVSDTALPQLRILQDTSFMTERISDMLGGAPVLVSDVTIARHKPGRRAILRYEIEQHRSHATVHAKTFASERGPRVYDVTRAITQAKAFGDDVALPDPVAYLSDLKLLVQRSVAGKPVEGKLLEGDSGLARRIATALHRFHTSWLDLGRSHSLAKELEPLELRVGQVAEHCPELRGRAGALLRRIQARDTSGFAWWHCPVHRDFYHDQVLLDGDRLAVLDLDDATMSEPTVDVANFVAHLMLLGAQRRGESFALQPVIDAFVGEYRRLDPALDLALLRFLTATTLVRLSGIHVSRENGRFVAEALLDGAIAQFDAVAPQPLPTRVVWPSQ